MPGVFQSQHKSDRVTEMQLAYIVHVHTPGNAGGETRSYQVAQALAEIGYRVHLYGQPDYGYAWDSRVVPHTLLSPTIRAAMQLHNEFSQASVDVCIERYQFPPFNVGLWVQLYRRKPIILEVHGFPIDEFRLLLGQQSGAETSKAIELLMKLPLGVWTRLQSFIFRHTDHFIVTSSGTKKILEQLGAKPSRITVVYNRVNTVMFDPTLYSHDSLRADFGFNPDEIVFFYGGSLFHEELLLVVEAFGHMLKQGVRGRLVLFGPAGSADHIKQYAKKSDIPSDSFSVSSAIPHHQMPQLLTAVDVVLAPYTLASELFQSAFHYSPLKIMEALSMAKPVVTVNAPELRSVFESVPNIIFVEESTRDSWTNAMLAAAEMRSDPCLCQGRAFVESGYRWIDAAQQYASIIEGLAFSS